MTKLALFLTVSILILLIGGMVYLANWDIPAPVQKVEKVLPDEQFPR